MKPKTNYKNQPQRDQCQTPPYALVDLLVESIIDYTLWESACGEGYLRNALVAKGMPVIGTDIIYDNFDFFKQVPSSVDIQVTNPPFSRKYEWLQRSYDIDKPFALLMPLETLGASRAQKLFRRYGMQMIVLDTRVNFKMPKSGWRGQAQFPVAWFTWGLELPESINYCSIDKQAKREWHEKENKGGLGNYG